MKAIKNITQNQNIILSHFLFFFFLPAYSLFSFLSLTSDFTSFQLSDVPE